MMLPTVPHESTGTLLTEAKRRKKQLKVDRTKIARDIRSRKVRAELSDEFDTEFDLPNQLDVSIRDPEAEIRIEMETFIPFKMPFFYHTEMMEKKLRRNLNANIVSIRIASGCCDRAVQLCPSYDIVIVSNTFEGINGLCRQR
ncbi:hypothetical protein FO519_002076 [Halicephalobus sp. NKZ332]|nr:hypothetical protein FO519_002076 [Halicephalobus sp. NKZ332]